MLTKGDLKNIDTLLSKRFKVELVPIKSDISKMRKDMRQSLSKSPKFPGLGRLLSTPHRAYFQVKY